MKGKDITKFANLKIALRMNVFELNGTVLTPIHINENYLQPQIDLLFHENHYCLITKLHCLINKNSHMKHVCRRCLTAFSFESVPIDHIDRCQKQKPTNITFNWKDQLKFKEYHMKVSVPIIVYADFKCINQPQYTAKLASHNPNTAKLAPHTEGTLCNRNVLFKQIPFVV